MQVYGFDIGGTTADAAIVEDGSVVDARTIETGRDRRPEDVVESLAEAALELAHTTGSAAPARAGAGIAGQVRGDDRHLDFAPNLGWRDVPLADLLEDRLEVPVALLNDVQAATLAEAKRGAGEGNGEVLVVFVGTGVGGGIFVGGELRRGCAGCAGEVGHVPVVHGGRECRCGARGCLEAYAGGWAIAARAREAVTEDPVAGAGLLREAGDAESITARTVASAAASGDDLARRLMAGTADHLASGVAGFINILSPCVVVLGGGVVLNAPGLFERVRDLALDRALPAATGRVAIRKARVGMAAGVIGAADWALHRIPD